MGTGTMLKVFLSVLMTTTFLKDATAYNVVLQIPNFEETENLTVIEDFDVNNTNANNSKEYFYIDFPKIGYQIFRKKIAQAMEIYDSFIEKHPVILKVDRTNFTSDGTINLTILDSNRTGEVYVSFSDVQQNPETNTESPLKANLTEIFENNVLNFSESSNVTQSHTNYSLPILETSKEDKTTVNETNKTVSNEENKTANYNANNTASFEGNKTSSNEANKTDSNGAKKLEVAPEGFFSKVSNTMTNIYHSLTSWF